LYKYFWYNITIANTITIAIAIAIAIFPDRMHTHTPTSDGKRARDSAGKSESVIYSPQDPIVYHSYKI
jgi:anti-sigma-K factor RskA